MKKIGIVTKREYLRRVNKKSFILITLFAPVLFAALVFVPLWLSSIKSSDIQEVAVVDHTGKYASLFENTDSFRFAVFGGQEPVEKSKEHHPGIFAFLEITDDLLKNPKAAAFYSEKQIPQDLKREVNRVLSQYLEKEKRASFNIPNIDEIIENSRVHIDVQTIKWGKDGTTTASSSEISSIIGMLFTLIIYMFIMMYGAMVMQGVMEEKTNRIVEIMVSSVRPFDLMMGKIIGIGLVGLTQVFMWCVLTAVLVGAGGMFMGISSGQELPDMQQYGAAAMSSSGGLLAKLGSFNFAEIIIYFVLFFIGGYISYASLFAAIGSAIDSPEDAQQFMTPIMVFLIFAVYAGIYSVNNPDGPLAFWCSLIPFTSPVVMMVRIPYEIPFWQIFVSLVLLFGSAVFMVWLSAKIYRVGILMYGKKPGFKEIARWVRY
ncbi:MAG: ABC transporter permease [Tannerella sp.]|jgi:ABC-2 type transport system permease protein|nr:ABC transporter permease [Tannerella sp.]